MGMYLNPGNEGFARMLKTEYVDKTGLISVINERIGTEQSLMCVSRPRRFGKSYAARLLCAYYDKTCNSRELFMPYKIAKDDSFIAHLNRYDVIYLDMTGLKPYTDSYRTLVPYLISEISREIKESYPEVKCNGNLTDSLIETVNKTGDKFIIIIDEWDAPIRENREIVSDYLEFLRSLFKNSGATGRIFAAAYMTGILPIKKDGSQSAISDFYEFTMIKPRYMGEYTGFTESEVKSLCEKHSIDFEKMKSWYDGYLFSEVGSVYNPNSVMKTIIFNDFDSYWTETSAATSLMDYISRDYNGLTKTIAELIGGLRVKVDTLGFANDLTSFRGKDDVLTLLIHLGYLAYDAESGTAYIPNEEVKKEFQKSIREVKHEATIKRLNDSDNLFWNTVHGNEEAVAEQIEKIHAEETAPLHYNREESLRSVIKLAYYTYRDNYLQWEELPAGEGYADIVYLPKKDSGWPALVVELKWNESADGAISQILDRKYPDALKDYGSEILLVGISYDKNAKPGERKHSCRIVKVGSI